MFLPAIWIKDFILTVNKYNFIFKILQDQNARRNGIYTERKKDRAKACSFYIVRVSAGLSLHMTTSGSVTCSPTGKACGRSSVGPALLVIYFLWQFILQFPSHWMYFTTRSKKKSGVSFIVGLGIFQTKYPSWSCVVVNFVSTWLDSSTQMLGEIIS